MFIGNQLACLIGEAPAPGGKADPAAGVAVELATRLVELTPAKGGNL